MTILASFVLFFPSCKNNTSDTGPRRLEILFLGHKNNTNHNSEKLAHILSQEYFKSGINLSFTSDPDDLNKENLAPYDGLIIYANHDTISSSQEAALLDYVRGGKGLIALHSASFCFRNSDEVVEMIGGQFKSHKYDTIQTVILKPEHEVMSGITPFATLDETYVHDKISPNIEVLTERVEGDHHEPYTWVRPYGKGRVFYTAYGHDDNTFNNQGFLDLVKNGIFWAIGDHGKAKLDGLEIPNPKYYDGGPVPNYEKRNPAPLVQEPLTPEQSMALMQVPVGFKLELFASEPMIVNPIFITWDEKGRLWAIETVDYPNEIKEGDTGDDRIKILEDTDGDGKADKVTVFAENLNIPTSFVFSNGGLIVSQSPSFLFLKDTNGDDVADVREEILPGWGKNDTHAQASNLRYGLDNQIWGVVGYSGYKNGKSGVDSVGFGNSMYRFDPNTRDLEFISTVSNNVWGLGFSEEFDIFASTANNTHTAFMGMPNRYMQKVGINETGVQKLDAHYEMRSVTQNLRQVDVMGGFTAAAGHSLYTARNFPKSYWNKIAFVTEPTGRVIHRVNLKQEGAGFIEDGDGWNLLTSADDWAAPILAEVGPDGAVWVADWYNFIIQHNPTPNVASAGIDAVNGPGNAYINPLRDVSKGRIYRISYKEMDKKNKLKLSADDASGLIKALSNDNMFWRTHAQRLLVEKNDKSVFSKLYKLVQNTNLDEIGLNPGAIHALWTLHGLKAFDGTNAEALEVAKKALTHPCAGVRKAAIQVLPKTAESFDAINKSDAFNDQDFRVRLAAVLATTDMPESAAIAKELVTMAEKEENFDDMWLNYGLTISSKMNAEGFRAEFLNRGMDANPSLMDASIAQRLAFGSQLTAMPLRRQFRRFSEDIKPEVIGNEFAISGAMQFNVPGPQGAAQSGPKPKPEYKGLVMAQGNRKDGYGLYFLDNKLNFTINQNGKAYTVSSTEPLPEKFTFMAGLQQDGFMKLKIDGKEVGSVMTQGLLSKDLDLPLRVGMDMGKGNDKIAIYPDTFMMPRYTPFTAGKLEILKRSTAPVASGPVDKVIELLVKKDVMKYETELLTAEAGTTIQIVLKNPDFMQHNFVLLKPNTAEKVGAAVDKLVTDPNGAKMHYVPAMPEVLAYTPMVDPGGSFTLTIVLPNQPGDYPYICTFPGHWRIMQGVLRVTKSSI